MKVGVVGVGLADVYGERKSLLTLQNVLKLHHIEYFKFKAPDLSDIMISF